VRGPPQEPKGRGGGGGVDHPLYRALELHQLEQHYHRLRESGVSRVEDLAQVTTLVHSCGS
jgi:hypothetical protein